MLTLTVAVAVFFVSLCTCRLSHNALAVLALAGAPDVPVFVGAGGPIAAPFHDLGGPLFHGVDGLGGVTPPGPGPRHGANLTLTAAEYIVEVVQQCNDFDIIFLHLPGSLPQTLLPSCCIVLHRVARGLER